MTKWMGKPPTECDFCHDPITDHFVDARLKTGSWGCVCKSCHSNYGVGIGTGRGQTYERKDGEFVKTGG